MSTTMLELTVPACATCKRPSAVIEVFPISTLNQPALVAAGLNPGHPANQFQGMPAADAAKILGGVAATMLTDPLKYMGLLSESDYDTSQYEMVVKRLMRFSALCETYDTGQITVESDEG